MVNNKEKTKFYVHVPSNIVRNEDFYLSNDEFVLYARLCFLYFRNYHNKEIEFDHKRLMDFLKISDTRTFKKRMKKLFDEGLIETNVINLPTKGSMKIVFNNKPIEECKHFTMISAEVFSYWKNEQIDKYAFRQLLYYKSHINLDDKENDRSFCYVGYETLTQRLKISKTDVKNANKKLEQAKLIAVTVHKLQNTNSYNDADELIFDRYNNHYHVTDKMH
ncbi:hypothetical protein V7139_18925 [Neobacillus drentensis]|uniref:hypothetical protein n=1 Tax=Neobacillus drentensis TaxID=220684 RepID=UPI0030028A71